MFHLGLFIAGDGSQVGPLVPLREFPVVNFELGELLAVKANPQRSGPLEQRARTVVAVILHERIMAQLTRNLAGRRIARA